MLVWSALTSGLGHHGNPANEGSEKQVYVPATPEEGHMRTGGTSSRELCLSFTGEDAPGTRAALPTLQSFSQGSAAAERGRDPPLLPAPLPPGSLATASKGAQRVLLSNWQRPCQKQRSIQKKPNESKSKEANPKLGFGLALVARLKVTKGSTWGMRVR